MGSALVIHAPSRLQLLARWIAAHTVLPAARRRHAGSSREMGAAAAAGPRAALLLCKLKCREERAARAVAGRAATSPLRLPTVPTLNNTSTPIPAPVVPCHARRHARQNLAWLAKDMELATAA